MQYIIDTKSNAMFTQIIGLTETLKNGEVPVIFQYRNLGENLIKQLHSALVEVKKKLALFDKSYHDDVHVASEFDYGCVVFRQGDLPITCIVQRRDCTLIIGSRQFGNQPIDLNALIKAIEASGELN